MAYLEIPVNSMWFLGPKALIHAEISLNMSKLIDKQTKQLIKCLQWLILINIWLFVLTK